MYQTLRDLLQNPDFTVHESFEIPGREAQYADIPQFLFESESPVGPYIQKTYSAGLWLHQSKALELVGRGENVVISSGTASGKSLIFQSAAFHQVLLEPSNKVVVFYPLRALVTDQLRSWRQMAQWLGQSEDIVGQIDGTVAVKDRDAILKEARIIVMTPDVCHAWMMSRLSMPVVKSFIGALSLVVTDEAHTLEGVFGSNFAFLSRRLIAARNHILAQRDNPKPLQFIGATATIANANEHMHKLIGVDFSVVDHSDDGAPSYDRIVAHIGCPPTSESLVAKEIQTRLLLDAEEGSFITFIDSRQGAETLAIAVQKELEDPQVAPYRAGLKADDRRRIETQLRNGKIRGVVSTAALELGIDIPRLTVGLNIGLPFSRKSYRQRIGRVGRSGPGAFVIIGPADTFSKFGSSLEEYHKMSVEPSYLYLDNRFMQFAHARCLAEERDSLKAPRSLPRLSWPSDFEAVYPQARPEGSRFPEFDAIAELGGGTPQYGYPLRNIGEVSYEIKRHEQDISIGDISHSQALREAYPGATYLHGGQAYEILGWNTYGVAPYIRVKQTSPYRSTRARITTWINADVTSTGLVGGHLVNSEEGFLAECQMLVTQKVVGYYDTHGHFNSYQDLRQTNPRMQSYSRNFRTIGIILCVEADWFKINEFKVEFADKLRDIFVHEYSIDPRDIGAAATHISVRGFGGNLQHAACIVVFDETYGSLRLTEKLYRDFTHILERTKNATQDDSDLTEKVSKVKSICLEFSEGNSAFEGAIPAPSGYEQVFAKDSVVCFRERGQATREIKIIRPYINDDGVLMYRTEPVYRPGQEPVRVSVPAARVEPSANSDAWAYAWWNRATEEYESPPEEAEETG